MTAMVDYTYSEGGKKGDTSAVCGFKNYTDLAPDYMSEGDSCKSVSDCSADTDQEVVCCMAGKCATDKACYHK